MKNVFLKVGFFLVILFIYQACEPTEQETPVQKTAPLAFVGTYTQKEPHVDGKGVGIIMYQTGSEVSDWQPLDTFTNIINPSFLCVSPTQPILYAVSEQGPNAPKPQSLIHVIQFDTLKKQMHELQRVSAMGHAPCYISVDRTGKHVLVANYVSGNIVHYTIKPDGRLGEGQSIQHEASGPHPRQESAHLHYIDQIPSESAFFAVDLGGDAIWKYGIQGDSLVRLDSLSTLPGAGPRHLVGHPAGKLFYVLNELSGTIEAWKKEKNTYNRFQNISLLPAGDSGVAGSADIHISKDGRFLYASLRGDFNQLVVLAVDTTTKQLSLIQRLDVGGKTPRNFAISTDESYIAVALQDSDQITLFQRDVKSGKLTRIQESIAVRTPVVIQFLDSVNK